ncbi:PREDICTED: vomeronasal type-1 receptor 1-like [Galeopterus variegatus]|uniref:Vomeronasal type-1 receptor n=1 Tax=Galeopterus variegatus TaxID=482537 RepID=A0ABM0SIS5_GALVR|nr:PREDICTED: vomeronasal type-1 receptor 1-like [Galeopterus variegatus]
MDGLVYINLNWGITLLTQTSAGILGNSSLLCLYNFTFIMAQRLRPTDLILSQLVLANNLVILSKGIPQTMAAFGLKSFLEEAGCKVVFYLQRVARGVTLSTTCLLSGFQAMKLCPSISLWMELKIKSPKCIIFSCFLCWILHLVLNISVVKHVTGPTNNKNMSMEKMYRYCSSTISGRLVFSVSAAIFLFTDVMFWGLMVWTSSFMVLFLYRHKQSRRCYFGHLRAHSDLPGPLTAGSRQADSLTHVYLSQTQLVQQSHALHHQNSHTLRLQFRISRAAARDIDAESPPWLPERLVHHANPVTDSTDETSHPAGHGRWSPENTDSSAPNMGTDKETQS